MMDSANFESSGHAGRTRRMPALGLWCLPNPSVSEGGGEAASGSGDARRVGQTLAACRYNCHLNNSLTALTIL
jgi:hypothetical protein